MSLQQFVANHRGTARPASATAPATGRIVVPSRPVIQAARSSAEKSHKVRLFGAEGTGTQLGEMFIAPGQVVELDLAGQFEGGRLVREGALLDRAGQAIMLGISPGDVHDPTEATNILLGYKNAKFRNSEACPIVPRDYEEDKYRTFNSSLAFRPAKVKTGIEGDHAEVMLPSSLTNYKMNWRRIGFFVPDPTKRQVTNPGFDIMYTGLRRCSLLIDMDLELDVFGSSGVLTTAANWATAQQNALASTYQWGGASGIGANSAPVKDLQAMAEASAELITHFWMNQRVANTLVRHPDVVAWMRQFYGDSQPGIQSVREMSNQNVDFKIHQVGTIHVCCARVESNVAGTTTDYVMADVVVGTALPDNPNSVPTNGEETASAYNFRLKGPAGVGFYTRSYRVEHRGSGGTMTVVEEASIPTMTSTIAGGIITAVLQ